MNKTIETIISELDSQEQQLDADAAAFHAVNKGKPDLTKLKALTDRRETLDAQKTKAGAEKAAKDQYKKKYLAESFCTESDFEQLWQNSLRFDAMREQVEGGATASKPNSRKGLYSNF